jgi:hypothetical protein
VNEVILAAAELQAVCEAQGWQFCFIGGVALMRWGQPRETVDADLTLLTSFGNEQAYIQVLLQHFEVRIPDAAEFALERRVLLLRSKNGVGLDVSLAGLPYEELVVGRSSLFDYPPKVSLRICSAEDLTVLKAFAGRDRDWADIERILIRQSGRLDWAYIRQHLRALAELKEDPGILEKLELLRLEIDPE